MDTTKFQILITGRILPDGQRERAISGLAEILKISESRSGHMLKDKATRLSTHFPRQQAEKIVQRMAAHGVECVLQPVEAAMQARKPALDMEIVVTKMQCPKCGRQQPEAEVCKHCGLVIGKYIEQTQHGILPKARRAGPAATSSFPYQVLNRLLQMVFLLSLFLAVLSYLKKDQFPSPDFYIQELLSEPLQTETKEQSFRTNANGITYTIEPKFDYQLNGVVVSYHDSDSFIDIYHHKDWKDFINIRDLCVIWGDNVSSGVYRDLNFRNATWTCWVSWTDAGTAERFSMQQLSNNHLLANDAELNQKIMQARPGDQVSFKGMLASYSHSNGQFQRGTSTTRGDTGNGACETVFLKDFSIVKQANTSWRMTYTLSRVFAVLSLIGLAVILFLAPTHQLRKGFRTSKPG